MEKSGKTDEHAWNDGEHVIYKSSVKYLSSIFCGLLWGKVCRKQTSKGLLPSFKHIKIKCRFCQCSLQTILRQNDLDIKTGLVSEENGNMEKSDHKILPCWESIFTALFSKSCFLVFFRHSLRALSKINSFGLQKSESTMNASIPLVHVA
jgi:hypothetical protein